MGHYQLEPDFDGDLPEEVSEMTIGLPRDSALERSILELAEGRTGWLRLNLHTGEVHVIDGGDVLFRCFLVPQRG
jgi:hypothetical protein